MTDLSVRVGPVALRSPLIAASGTVGSVVDFTTVASPEPYGAMVAKSVAPEPWPGNEVPRMGPAGAGMLNSIGIQNPGIEAWVAEYADRIAGVGVPVWGSAVGHQPEDFAIVAKGLEGAGVTAVEINLSCPNLSGESLIALDPVASGAVVAAVRAATTLPIGAKLSPNAQDIGSVADAVAQAGADWLVATNTAWGAAIDVETRRPILRGVAGGYSGPPLKPIALRCVMEVARAVPSIPIVGCGGVVSGEDVVEYVLAGASAVAIGSVHFAEPRAGGRIAREVGRWCAERGVTRLEELVGGMEAW